ncbi:MAG: hypothetical protein M1834_008106 [Cirrosporium novae-zelandiae]|nr:MAG: hypothetical protein M1834_008106 [Cirrosporium novae-zelandiae]
MGCSMTGKRAYNWYISLVAAASMQIYGYDASVFNSVQGSDNWLEWFDNPSNEMLGAINTSYVVGAIVGGWFFGGPVADYLGRKCGMAIGCFLVVIATFVQAFSPKGDIGAFIGGRVLIGLGQGIALTSGPIYIGELAPAEIRGKIMSFWQMFYSVGSFICFWVNYGCTQHKEHLGQWDWRMVVMFQLLVPIIVLVLIPFIPGTPRWFIKHGNNVDKARQALRRVRDTEEDIEDEIRVIREAIEYEKEALSGGYKAIFTDPSIRKRLLLAFIINACQQVSGQGTLNTYSTKIYQQVFSKASQISLINALNATFGILFTLNATWTVDRFGRKFLLIVGGIGMGICMIIVAAVDTETPDVNGIKSQPVGISLVFLLFLFMMFYKPSWGATVWIWTSEIFSLNVRAQAVGMASQCQNIANAIVQQFFPTFLDNCGFYAFYMFAGINFLMAIFVYFCIPETKQVSLEEIDALFGGANHVEKGASLISTVNSHQSYGDGGSSDKRIARTREIEG